MFGTATMISPNMKAITDDIKIDVIAFNVHDSDDLAQLKCTADVTGGHFSQPDTRAELFRAMEDFITPHKEVEAVIFKENN